MIVGDIVILKKWDEIEAEASAMWDRETCNEYAQFFDGKTRRVVAGNGWNSVSILGTCVYIPESFASDTGESIMGLDWSSPEEERKLREFGLPCGMYVLNVPEESEWWGEYGYMHGKIVTVMNPLRRLGDVFNGNTKVAFWDETLPTQYVPVDILVPRSEYPEDYVQPAIRMIRRRCANCGNHFMSEREVLDEMDFEDIDLCPQCRKREFVLPYHKYYPKLEFWKEPTDKDELYLGAEIEIDEGGENNRTAGEIVRKMNDGKWFMWCSHDSSLANGMELITAPATLAAHKAKRSAYTDLFQYLIEKGYRAHNTSSCGLHIHFNRDFLGLGAEEESNLCKLLYLVEKFWREIVIFSRRDYRSLERYAKKIDSNPSNFVSEWNKSGEHEGHYFSINITNDTTVEFRMFRGTLSLKTYFATLSFVDNLVRQVKKHSIEELQTMGFEDLLSREAKTYYRRRLEILDYDETPVSPVGEPTHEEDGGLDPFSLSF